MTIILVCELKKLTEILQPLLNPSKPDVEIKQLLESLRAEVVELRASLPPKKEKINLLSASQDEILNALAEAGARKQYANAALQAIQYWKNSDRGLTWTNLKESTQKGKSRVASFGKVTYRKLQEIAEIK